MGQFKVTRSKMKTLFVVLCLAAWPCPPLPLRWCFLMLDMLASIPMLLPQSLPMLHSSLAWCTLWLRPTCMTPLATSLMTATLRPRLMSMTQLGTHRANDNILKSIGLKIENILNELLSIQYIDLLWILYPGYRPGLSMIATFSFICILYKQLMSV